MTDHRALGDERTDRRRHHPSGAVATVTVLAGVAVIAGAIVSSQVRPGAPVSPTEAAGIVAPLPSPRLEGDLSLEAALQARRSVRDFTDEALTIAEIGQLLWAAQGRTDEAGSARLPRPALSTRSRSTS